MSDAPLVDDRTVELLAKAAKALVVAVNIIVITTLIMLSLGFVLLLAGASPEASFVDWVYRNVERSMGPFRGMFPIEEFDGRSVFDASLLFAAAVYGFVALGLQALVAYLTGIARAHHHNVTFEPRRDGASGEPATAGRSTDATDPLVTIKSRPQSDSGR